jgi:hypothetical protein
MEPQDSTIPKFRADGYLPEGLYLASKTEVMFRFGSSSRRRRRLVLRIRRWIELARLIGGLRLLIDGSFVTAKAEPDDIDAVILLPPDFQHQIEQGIEAALELGCGTFLDILTSRTIYVIRDICHADQE